MKEQEHFSKNSQAKNINAKIMEFVALDNQPFSVVDDVRFCRLVEHRYTLPSRLYFSDVALSELHSIVETHIHELLAIGVTAISFTTDIWTSDVSPMSTVRNEHPPNAGRFSIWRESQKAVRHTGG